MVERLASDATSEVDNGLGAVALGRQIPSDRFEIVDEPLGWRCRSCGATVTGAAVARLAESAADHALYCGRCDD